MGLSCGLIGLPNVGKTSVFNALVGAGGVVANYPFSTVETQVGVSTIPDVRLSGIGRESSGVTAQQAARQLLSPILKAATDAAVRYLEELHQQFGSWFLALAAYNAGPDRVQTLIDRYLPGVEPSIFGRPDRLRTWLIRS